jgi:hypothetical protein
MDGLDKCHADATHAQHWFVIDLQLYERRGVKDTTS